MSEMKHPPLDLDQQKEPSFEEAFCGRMMTLLAAYKCDVTEIQGDYRVTYPVTDRIDIMRHEFSIGGALRIRRLQSLALTEVVHEDQAQQGGSVKVGTRTEDYTILALEYGEPEEDNLQVTDDDFTWRPYVMCVASNHIRKTTLLDGATGQELSGGDLAEASHRLDFFARQISHAAYECFAACDDSELAIERVPLPTGSNRTFGNMFHEFNPANTRDANYDSHACFEGCPLETHPESIKN